MKKYIGIVVLLFGITAAIVQASGIPSRWPERSVPVSPRLEDHILPKIDIKELPEVDPVLLNFKTNGDITDVWVKNMRTGRLYDVRVTRDEDMKGYHGVVPESRKGDAMHILVHINGKWSDAGIVKPTVE